MSDKDIYSLALNCPKDRITLRLLFVKSLDHPLTKADIVLKKKLEKIYTDDDSYAPIINEYTMGRLYTTWEKKEGIASSRITITKLGINAIHNGEIGSELKDKRKTKRTSYLAWLALGVSFAALIKDYVPVIWAFFIRQ